MRPSRSSGVFGEAVVLDLSSRQPGAPITAADLERYDEVISPGARVPTRTDWDTHFGAEQYFADFPPLAPETADWLVERGVWLLGVDMPSLHLEHGGPMHETLLGAEVVIVESLANLRELRESRVLLSCLPLSLPGADGAPVRAAAYDGLPGAVGTGNHEGSPGAL